MSLLSVENVDKYYFRKIALNNISFEVKKGEIFGLLGPNGAGKTTLIRLINKITNPNKGTIKFNNEYLSDKHLKKIGYLPEERGLYTSLSVEEHVIFLATLKGLTKSEAKESLNYWLNKFEISNWKNKKIEQLSKGMAQKVQFICSVIHNPELLILDEPLSGFDPINIHLIVQILHELKKDGKTIILSTHDMKNVEEICDRILLLNHSKKIIEGSVSELREKHNKGLYGIRFKGNMIAFATALWTDFELVEKKEISKDKFEVIVKKRGDQKLDDFIKAMLDKVEIDAVWNILPGMQEVFIGLIDKNLSTENEK